MPVPFELCKANSLQRQHRRSDNMDEPLAIMEENINEDGIVHSGKVEGSRESGA